MSKKSVTITLSHSILERLDQIAESRGESRSAVIERICRNGMDSEESFIKLLGHPVGAFVLNRLASPDALTGTLMKLAGQEFSEEERASLRRLLGESEGVTGNPEGEPV